MTDPYAEFHVAHPLYLKGAYREKQRVLDIMHHELRGIKRVIVATRISENADEKMKAFTARAAYVQRLIDMINAN
jgi:hypothetical protein